MRISPELVRGLGGAIAAIALLGYFMYDAMQDDAERDLIESDPTAQAEADFARGDVAFFLVAELGKYEDDTYRNNGEWEIAGDIDRSILENYPKRKRLDSTLVITATFGMIEKRQKAVWFAIRYNQHLAEILATQTDTSE